MKSKVLSLLGLCKRAGYLTEGMDAVGAKAREKQANLLVVAKDISQNTLKKVEKLARETNTPLLQPPLTKEEFGYGINSFAAVLCIGDKGMADQVMKLVSDGENGG